MKEPSDEAPTLVAANSNETAAAASTSLNSAVSSNGSQLRDPVPESRYVDLEGDVQIGLSEEGRFTIYFVQNGQVINEDEPLQVTKKHSDINQETGQRNRLKLFGVKLIASFTEESFNRHFRTIRQVNSSVTDWNSAEPPQQSQILDMTSIGPPHN